MNPLFLDLGHDVFCVETGYQRPGLAALYIVIERGRAAVIDTGTSHSVPNILSTLEHHGIGPGAVDFILPTHVHLDHAGGAGALARVLENARVVIHPRGVRHLVDPARLIESATAVYGKAEFDRLFGTLTPVPGDRVQEATDGLELDLNGRRLEILDTPGHARHHYCVYDERSGGLFTGDTFGLSYPEFNRGGAPFVFPTTTPVQFDPEAWYGTIDRILSYPAERAYLTHFGKIEGIQEAAVDLRRRIEGHVRIARSATGDGDRTARIREELRDYLVSELQGSGGVSDAELAESVFGMDLELNTQGLEVWLDRSH